MTLQHECRYRETLVFQMFLLRETDFYGLVSFKKLLTTYRQSLLRGAQEIVKTSKLNKLISMVERLKATVNSFAHYTVLIKPEIGMFQLRV